MDKSDELIIRGYDCPLCGKEVPHTGFFTRWFSHGIYWLLDITPCCRVWVAWLPIEGILIYVGTFRNEQAFFDWADSAGTFSHWLPTGKYWDHETQMPTSDIDEIPF